MLWNAQLLSKNMRFWVVALACSVNLIFGTFLLANNLGVWYYHFYTLQVVNIVIFSPFLDWLIWFISAILIVTEMVARILLGRQKNRVPLWTTIPNVLLLASFAIFSFNSQMAAIVSALLGFAVVALSVYYGKGSLFASRREAVALVLAGSGALLIPIEAASLASWILNAFDYEVPFSYSPRWVFPTIDLNLFSLLYPLVSLLLLIFLFCWVWMPFYKRLLMRWGKWRSSSAAEAPWAHGVGWRPQAVVLLITAAVAGFVAYYPYIRLSSQYLVGVDGVRYFDFLSRMINEGPFATVAPDRPLFMLLLYYIKAVTLQPAEIIVRVMPVICAVFLVLAVFWLVKTGTKDVRLALLSSILTAFSFQVTAGMIGYFLAAWFALAEILLFFTLLLKAMEKRPLVYSLLAGAVSIVILGTHPYSWLLMATILSFYIVVTVLVRRGIKREVLISTIPLAITAVVAIPLILYTSIGANGVPVVMGIVNSLWQTLVANLNISKLSLLLPSLSHMADRWVGGAFGSPVIYILSILGMASMVDLTKNFNRLLLCWVLVPSLAIFALVPGMEQLYYRIAYIMPFQIPAAVGFLWLLSRLSRTRSFVELKPAKITYFNLLRIVLFLLLILLLFNYALRLVDEAVVVMI
jgi:hypothetical protein